VNTTQSSHQQQASAGFLGQSNGPPPATPPGLRPRSNAPNNHSNSEDSDYGDNLYNEGNDAEIEGEAPAGDKDFRGGNAHPSGHGRSDMPRAALIAILIIISTSGTLILFVVTASCCSRVFHHPSKNLSLSEITKPPEFLTQPGPHRRIAPRAPRRPVRYCAYAIDLYQPSVALSSRRHSSVRATELRVLDRSCHTSVRIAPSDVTPLPSPPLLPQPPPPPLPLPQSPDSPGSSCSDSFMHVYVSSILPTSHVGVDPALLAHPQLPPPLLDNGEAYSEELRVECEPGVPASLAALTCREAAGSVNSICSSTEAASPCPSQTLAIRMAPQDACRTSPTAIEANNCGRTESNSREACSTTATTAEASAFRVPTVSSGGAADTRQPVQMASRLDCRLSDEQLGSCQGTCTGCSLIEGPEACSNACSKDICRTLRSGQACTSEFAVMPGCHQRIPTFVHHSEPTPCNMSRVIYRGAVARLEASEESISVIPEENGFRTVDPLLQASLSHCTSPPPPPYQPCECDFGGVTLEAASRSADPGSYGAEGEVSGTGVVIPGTFCASASESLAARAFGQTLQHPHHPEGTSAGAADEQEATLRHACSGAT
jgi:hypothetical protein